MLEFRTDIENAPHDGSYVLVSLKSRHWYDGPSVVSWDGDSKHWWLSEGYLFQDSDIRGWFAIPQAEF